MKTIFTLLAVVLLTLSFPNSSVYAQWTAISPPDPDLALNAVHFISNEGGAVASVPSDPFAGAAATKYKWNTTYSSKFTVSGLASESDTTYGDCTLYDNGTFNCYEDEHGADRNYTGTYAYIGKTGYKIQFVFDSNGLQEYSDMLTGWVEDLANEEGADISNISFNFTSVKTSQVTISKKTGIPGKATLTIKGKISAVLDGKYTTKNFSFRSNITFQYAPPPEQYTLTVQKAGSGSGMVTGSGINCGSTCSESLPSGTQVVLVAAGDGSTFTSWSGCDSSNGNACLVAMNQNKTVTATFTLTPYTLTVNKSGTGSGTVTGGGINCGSTCSKSLPSGTQVTLTATASIGFMLASWSGCDSSNANQCTVTMTQNRTVTATFATPYTLTVNKSGTGSGTVIGGGINCGSTCSESLPSGTQVTLTATASSGSTFMSWSGCDSSNTNQCTVTMNQNKTPTAAFAQGDMVTMRAIGSVPGEYVNFYWWGAPALNPPRPADTYDCAGIPNPTLCTPLFLEGSTVYLALLEPPGNTFSGWSGCDSVAPYTNMNGKAIQLCTFTVTPNRVITAIFNNICPSGDNWCSGTCISSNDPLNCGICGRDCTQYDKVTQVQAYYACTQGRCTFNGCKPGWTSCYGTNTCDTKTDTDINNCGGCRQACPQPWSSGIGCPGTWDAVVIIEGRGPTSSYQCVNGACVGICCPNFATCDSSEGQCTTDLRGDNNNCGRCGHDCGSCWNVPNSCMFSHCISNPACW